MTGFALAFARAVGEYGSVVFVAGNMPFRTEIAPVLIVHRLEEFAYGEATAIAVVLLGISFFALVAINAWNAGASAMQVETIKPPDLARIRKAQADHWLVRWTLTSLALATLGLLVIVPVVNVFYQALAPGLATYLGNLVRRSGHPACHLVDADRRPGRCRLERRLRRGRGLGHRPLPVSRPAGAHDLDRPALLGLAGRGRLGVCSAVRLHRDHWGTWLRRPWHQVLFAPPGLLLATTFVTLPFVARELIPVLEAIGPEEDLAAVSLGATGWQMFWRVTLPNIQWGCLYGVILCNARAMGEFGAVYVVSGHIAGQTDTMPLRVEKLFQEYNTPAAFAVASVLTLLALVTLVLKSMVEKRTRHTVSSDSGPSRGEA